MFQLLFRLLRVCPLVAGMPDLDDATAEADAGELVRLQLTVWEQLL
jgi:hypothetical protein